MPQYATLFQQMCKPAGITVTQPAADPGAVLRLQAAVAQVPMGITDWAARAMPSQFFMMLTSKGVWNFALEGHAVRQAGAAVRRHPGRSRAKIATQMATIMQDETPVIIAYWIEVLRATTKKVGGVEANGSEFLDLTRAFYRRPRGGAPSAAVATDGAPPPLSGGEAPSTEPACGWASIRSA